MKKQAIRLVRLAVAFVFGAIVAISARSAHAANFNWCVNMATDLTDTDIGENYLLTTQGNPLGRFLWVRLSRSDGTKTWPLTYLDGLGCLPFSDTTNGPFKLEIRSQARIPRSDNGANNNTLRVLTSTGDLAEWTYFKTFPAGGGNHSTTLPQTRRTNLLAAASYALHRFSDGLASKTINVRDATCAFYVTPSSCASGTDSVTADVYILPGDDRKKFLIAHELGHAVQWLWFNFHSPASLDDYELNDGGASCEWSNPSQLASRLHALHTKEYSSVAFVEGFGQYYATYAYNDTSTTAWFHYYKDDYKNPPVTLVNMENGNTGGATTYLDDVCTNDVHGKAGMGVELDWARQLWDYRTNAGTAPTNSQIMRQTKNGLDAGAWSNTNTWARTEAGVEEYDDDNGTSFADRWHDLGVANGINH